MALPKYSEANKEIYDEKLGEIGKQLAQCPSSAPELQALLEEALTILDEVWQYPPDSTARAVAPVMKELVSNKIFEQTDIDIRVTHAACLNETIRITLPEPPYDDDEMKKIFELFMVVLKELSGDFDTENYTKVYRILQYMVKLQTCLIVLDLECDEKMAVDLFLLFFNLIDPDHHPSIFEFMETTMAMMIDEIDEIPLALVETLLFSVRLDKKDTSPVSWRLGKRVLEKTVTRLKTHVWEAVRINNLDARDYAVVVSSLCRDAPAEINTVEGKAGETVEPTGVNLSSAEASADEGISPEEVKDGAPEAKDGYKNIKENESMLEALETCTLKNGDTRSDTQAVNSGSGTNLKTGQLSETNKLSSRAKRGRKPNSLLRPEEGYQFSWAMGGCRSTCRFSEDIIKEENDSPLPSGPGKEDAQDGSSRKEPDSIEESSTRKRGRSRNAESVSQQSELEPLVNRKRKAVVQSNVNENLRASKKGKRKPKQVCTMDEVSIVKEEANLSGNDSETENKPLGKKPHQKRLFEAGNTSKKTKKKNASDKMGESSVFTPAEDETAECTVSGMENETGRAPVEYGEEVVNSRIMVWWPLDKTFYTGTIASYDPAIKKHKVIYDDDEEEVLSLSVEKWKFFNEGLQVQPPLEATQAAAKTQKKEPRKRGGSSKKPASSSSSKRLRSGGQDAVKQEVEDCVRSESSDEASDSYFS